jgi:hypothetical protein
MTKKVDLIGNVVSILKGLLGEDVFETVLLHGGCFALDGEGEGLNLSIIFCKDTLDEQKEGYRRLLKNGGRLIVCYPKEVKQLSEGGFDVNIRAEIITEDNIDEQFGVIREILPDEGLKNSS